MTILQLRNNFECFVTEISINYLNAIFFEIYYL